MPIEGFYIFERKFYFLAYVLVIIILSLIYLIDDKKINHRVLLITLIILISLSIIYGSSLYFSVTNTDSYIVFDLAKNSLNLNFNDLKIFLSNDNYLNNYPHQFGIYSLNYILILLFKDSADIAFTILNIISVYISSVSLFFITKKIFNSNKVLFIFVILQSLFLMPFLSITYHYDWQIGLALICISLLCYICFKESYKYKYLIFSLLALVVATYLKPNYIILGLAYLVYELVLLLINRKIKSLLLVIIILLSNLIATNSSKFLYQCFTNAKHDGIPQISYLAMGLQSGELGNGWYNGYHVMLYDKYDGNIDLIKDESKEYVKNTIKDFINNPLGAVYFFKDKWDSFMLIKDYNLHSYYSYAFNTIPQFHNDIADTILYFTNNISFYLNFLGLIIFFVFSIKKYNISSLTNIMLISLIGALIYHLLFETKAIYIYPWINFVLPLAASGLNIILVIIKGVCKFEKKKVNI